MKATVTTTLIDARKAQDIIANTNHGISVDRTFYNVFVFECEDEDFEEMLNDIDNLLEGINFDIV